MKVTAWRGFVRRTQGGGTVKSERPRPCRPGANVRCPWPSGPAGAGRPCSWATAGRHMRLWIIDIWAPGPLAARQQSARCFHHPKAEPEL